MLYKKLIYKDLDSYIKSENHIIKQLYNKGDIYECSNGKRYTIMEYDHNINEYIAEEKFDKELEYKAFTQKQLNEIFKKYNAKLLNEYNDKDYDHIDVNFLEKFKTKLNPLSSFSASNPNAVNNNILQILKEGDDTSHNFYMAFSELPRTTFTETIARFNNTGEELKQQMKSEGKIFSYQPIENDTPPGEVGRRTTVLFSGNITSLGYQKCALGYYKLNYFLFKDIDKLMDTLKAADIEPEWDLEED